MNYLKEVVAMDLDNKLVLVTGGAGFIGSTLCEALIKKRAQVTIVDLLSTTNADNLSGISSKVKLLEIDIRSSNLTNLITDTKFDIIFHLAGNASVNKSVKDPEYDFQVNLSAPIRILETIRYSTLKTVLIAISSAAVYGNLTYTQLSEEHATSPISPYGVSKLAFEQYINVYSHLYGIKAASVRLFPVYGPRQKKQVVYDFIDKIYRATSGLEIQGDGMQMRDLVFVDDVIQALLCIYARAPLVGETYNVATGIAYSTKDLAEMIFKIMDLEPNYYFTGFTKPGNPDILKADIRRIRKLGYKTEVGIEEGIIKTIEWYRSIARNINKIATKRII